MRGKAATGTVYALLDPRDDVPRYIGATTQTLEQRLKGHLGTPSKKVRPWIEELRAAGLSPRPVPLHEGVQVGDLLAIENEEITRILAVGGTLLNEQSTARGRELNQQRKYAERRSAEQAGWRKLADVALATFGGPMPPSPAPGPVIPDEVWRLMVFPMPELGWHDTKTREDLWEHTCAAWSELGSVASDNHRWFDRRMDRQFTDVAREISVSRADTEKHLALLIWFAVAVEPWWHLASLSGLTEDSGTFIAWAGRDIRVREALRFLASRPRPALTALADDWDKDKLFTAGPGLLLATVAAAYTSTTPTEAVRPDVLHCLAKLASDHQITQPMADLLVSLNPKALDAAFGPDVMSKVDKELDLPPGTSVSVVRSIAKHTGSIQDRRIERALDRSAQALPVEDLPDYGTWWGRGILGARVVSAHIVQAGLGTSDWDTPEDYVAKIRALWVPDTQEQRRTAAA